MAGQIFLDLALSDFALCMFHTFVKMDREHEGRNKPYVRTYGAQMIHLRNQ